MEGKNRILVAEDSRADAELFQRAIRPFLKGNAVLVDYVLDGDEAMRSLKEKNYDLLFLDMSMPGPTGIEILRFIKENHRKEKVFILTGYSDLDAHFCKQLGVDEYFEKPLSSRTLRTILEKYLPQIERHDPKGSVGEL
ncbi:MAG: response regulator [Candidatus Omnitrophota bacterium]